MPTTILIADDDPIQRRLLTEMVKRAGYDPTSPAEAGGIKRVTVKTPFTMTA
jgi:CheY-like chemotaxis protein